MHTSIPTALGHPPLTAGVCRLLQALQGGLVMVSFYNRFPHMR